MRVIITRLFLCCGFVIAASEMRAARPEINHVRAIVKHYDGTLEFWDGARLRTIPLREQMAFRLGENDELSIIVEQTNPLLFIYDIKEGPSTPNASYAAASKFVEVLKKVAALLPEAGGVDQTGEQRGGGEGESAAARVLAQAGFDAAFVKSYGDNVEKIRDAVKNIPALVEKSGKSWADARAVKATTEGWTPLLSDTEKQLETIQQAHKALYDFARGATSAPPAKNDQAKGRTKDEFKDTSGTPGTQVDVKGKAKVGEEVNDDNATGSTDQNVILVFDFIRDDATKVDDAIGKLREFQELAAEIGKPIRKDQLVASLENDGSQILTVTPQEDAGTAPAKATPKAGEYKLLIKADTAVEYELMEPAVVYSLVEREDWDTKATADGKFEIVRQDDGNEINGTTLAGMLSITPRALNDWSFAPSFQIGFSPVKDRFGLFAGVSFRVYELFKFGGGIAYQQTEKLSSSQHAGQLLDAADDLDVEIEPDTGFYFGLTINLGKK